MKYLAIILILFALPALASDYDKDWPALDAEVCFVVDTSILHRFENAPSKPEPKPIITDKGLDFIFNVLTVIANPLSP